MTFESVFEIIFKNNLLQAGLVFLAALIVSRLVRKYLTKFFESSSLQLKVDVTQYNFIKNASSAIILGSAVAFAFFSIPSLRSLGATLFAGAGILAAILAFASQQAMSNIINGVFIVIFKPFRVGDIIEVGGQFLGTVEDITLRHTVINSFENRRIIMPNSTIGNETIVNSTIKESKVCKFMEYGIAYDADFDKAREIIYQESVNHPACIDNRSEHDKSNGVPKVDVRMIGHGDFSIKIRAYFWAKSPIEARMAQFDLLESVKRRFDEEGIEIPFPYRTIVYKKDITSDKE